MKPNDTDVYGLEGTTRVPGESYSGAPDGLETQWDHIQRKLRQEVDRSDRAVVHTKHGSFFIRYERGGHAIDPVAMRDPYGLDTGATNG